MPLVNIKTAVDLLSSGTPVALPTETVYGLGAPIYDKCALEKVFALKKRPFFDPLIVHVLDIEQAQTLTQWNDLAQTLAHHFWPGPLTLILKKTSEVFDIITSGRPTVGIRSPSHPTFRNIIQRVNTPLAAPSANLFGKTSPTLPEHILEEMPRVSVLDGGPCVHGIESTILEITQSGNHYSLCILRPGPILPRTIQKVCSSFSFSFQESLPKEHVTPGSLKNHYQPKKTLVLLNFEPTSYPNWRDSLQRVPSLDAKGPIMTLSSQPHLAARELYGKLRSMDQSPHSHIYVPFLQSQYTKEEWTPVGDRLKKAASLLLRPINSPRQFEALEI